MTIGPEGRAFGRPSGAAQAVGRRDEVMFVRVSMPAI
jgi:hypothetical protein